MSHTPEEMIAFVEVDGVAVSLFRSNTRLTLTVSGSKEYVKTIPTLTAYEQKIEEARREVAEAIYAELPEWQFKEEKRVRDFLGQWFTPTKTDKQEV